MKRKHRHHFSRKKKFILGFLVFVLSLGLGFSVFSTNIGVLASIGITRYKEPIILETSGADLERFRSYTYRDKIKTINLDDEINPPANYIESWDIGVAQNGNVMAYLTTNQDNSSYYDLYIQGDGHLYANENSQYLFAYLKGVDVINGIDKLDVSRVTNMSYMFADVGYNSNVFTLDLGNNFDTSNVTDMSYMFYRTGDNCTVFTLDLGDNFDTSNVTNMMSMFYLTGYKSTVFTLDLGNKFDTSNVTSMQAMFYNMGVKSTIFTLNLGDKFDTSNVTTMRYMFYDIGGEGATFSLDLGDKFDTSNVTNMQSMFFQT
ncbi:MAG: BspA family leucine-rich repeat surface protein, partial [Bacilli bacterium]|nr:BspA family leucine-rich repeat surface protein [Bacilli bacterium]